jgi:hypothetical protein
VELNEKIEAMRTGILPDVEENDAVLEAELMNAEAMILNKMYPFGYSNDTTIPTRYDRLQVKLAIELYTQRGAEGQTSHSENGISRSWSPTSRILAQIPSHCGSVTSNA